MIDDGIKIILAIADKAREALDARRRYREYLDFCISACYKLGRDSIAKISDPGGGEWLPPMNSAFVPLNLADMRGRETSLRDAFAGSARLIIQGPPGAGKSTLLKYVALVMARSLGGDAMQSLAQKRLGVHPHLPIFVELRDYRRETRLYDDLIVAALGSDPPRMLRDRLERDDVVYLLDGLDEVPLDAHTQLVNEIIDLTDRRPKHRFLVSTRSATYRFEDLAPGSFKSFSIQPFNSRQQTLLVHRYFTTWANNKLNPRGMPPEQQANDLMQEIEGNPTLSRLAGNPLLLSFVAFLYYRGEQAGLFRNKPEIYHACVRHLLMRRSPAADRLVTDQEANIAEQFVLLSELAWAMQNERTVAAMSGERITDILSQTIRRRKLGTVSAASVGEMEERWGLLVHEQETRRDSRATYTFAQQSFQEYLAANAVHEFPDEYWPMLQANIRAEHWREVLLLYVSMPADRRGIVPLNRALQALIPRNESPSVYDAILGGACLASAEAVAVPSRLRDYIVGQLDYWAGDHNSAPTDMRARALDVLALIAPEGTGRALRWIRERSPNGTEVLPEHFGKVGNDARQVLRSALLQELHAQREPCQRIVIARWLAQVGDTRLGDTVSVQGVRDQDQGQLRAGTYPVTNAEYLRFVEASGAAYAPAHWSRGRPLASQMNCPVVGVSWVEANDYCGWLSGILEHDVFLPTEAEWEALAAGLREDDRFPWGRGLNIECLNYRAEYGGVIPVGVLPEGKSAAQAHDVLGNVWEWTATQSGKDAYVVKGGAWDTMDDIAAAGIQMRSVLPRDTRQPNVGFRVFHRESTQVDDILDQPAGPMTRPGDKRPSAGPR